MTDSIFSNQRPHNPSKSNKPRKKLNKPTPANWESFKSKGISANIYQWAPADFVKYFLHEYHIAHGFLAKNKGQFRLEVLAKIADRIKSSKYGYCNNETLKKYIDWFIKTDVPEVLSKKIADPEQVLNMWNLMSSDASWIKFSQDGLLKLIDFQNYGAIPEADEISQSNLTSNISFMMTDIKNPIEALAYYGIPLIATYMHRLMKIEPTEIIAIIRQAVEKSAKKSENSPREVSQIVKVIGQSIARSPYPDWFAMLKWQDRFLDILKHSKFYPDGKWIMHPMNGEFLEEYNDLK